MILDYNINTIFVFDLDDTLYKEIDFVRSAFKEIATIVVPDNENIVDEMIYNFRNGRNVHSFLVNKSGSDFLSLEEFVKIYRNHRPHISPDSESLILLNKLKESGVNTAIITDGRSITQRNKLAALGIENYFDEILISEEFGSEKTDLKNFTHFHSLYPNGEFYYIADNPLKDFFNPNKLGWITIMLADNGLNIHNQNLSYLPIKYHPNYIIKSFSEIQIQKRITETDYGVE